MGINVELYRKVLTTLDIKLLDAILTEKTEDTLTGVLTWNFNHILL